MSKPKKKKLTAREKKFAEGIKELRFLIADPTSSRKSLRALLSHHGIKPERILVTEGLQESIDAIAAHKPNVLFADLSVGESQGLSLVEHHRAAVPPDEIRVFFLSTTENSRLLFSGAAEEHVDGIIVKPFTFDSLNGIFVEQCSDRLDPTVYQKAIHLTQAHLDAGELDKALSLCQSAKRIDPKPTLAWAIEGRILLGKKDTAAALRSFEAGLAIDPHHYRSLVGALDCYIALGEHAKGYEVVRKLSETHTIPLQRIPDLIRLAILNGKFADMIGFYEYGDAIAEAYPSATQYLAAGLVVCGIYFARKNSRSEALDAFRKAEVACRKYPKIQTRLLCAMIQADFVEEITIVSARMPEEIRESSEVRMAELMRMDRLSPPIQTLQHAINLFRQGFRARELFEILLKRSVELKRSNVNIDDILHAAEKAFPELKAHFAELAAAGKA